LGGSSALSARSALIGQLPASIAAAFVRIIKSIETLKPINPKCKVRKLIASTNKLVKNTKETQKTITEKFNPMHTDSLK
jgi:hypothetical protein